jgi:Tol biopolymer transport system component
VLRHCLEKKPDLRFQSARDLAFALEALSGLSGRGTASGVAAAAAPPVTKRRWQTLAAGIPVAAVAVAAAFLAGERIANRPFPSFHQLTFRQGYISSARFAPDGQTVIYGAAWDGGPLQIYSTRPEGPESRPLGLGADVLSMSKSGEMAISLGRKYKGHMSSGTLGRMLLAGAAPREILEAVQEADWAPNGQLALVRRVEGKHRLEYPYGKVLYETEGWFSHARISPDGNRIAFLDHPLYADDRGSVAVMDRAGNKRTLTGDWPSAQGLAWSPSGREAWFTASEAGSNRALWAVPASGGGARLVYRMAGTLTLHDIYPDGRMLMSHDKMQLRVMSKAAGETQDRDLTWFDWSYARDLSADGKTLVISEQGEAGGPRYMIYIRKADGSPGVRIGEGSAQGLSPDGKFVLVTLIHTSPNQLVLLPTGAGEGKSLSYASFNYLNAMWFRDGKRILVSANEPGKAAWLYVQDLAGGKPREVVRETALSPTISQDGRLVAFQDAHDRVAVCPVEACVPREIAGVEAGERPINWSSDGKSLWVFQAGETPARVYQVDVTTGKRELWKELRPADPAGTRGINRVLITPDGKSYAYHYNRFLSELFLVEGLR